MKTPSRHALNRFLPWLLAAFVFVSGSGFTLVYWSQTHRQEQAALDILFRSESERVAASIVDQLETYQTVMRGIQGFFRGSERVHYREFANYIAALEVPRELRGVKGVAFVVPVAGSERRQHLEEIRAELPVPYELHPSGEREHLAPIVYIEPLTGSNLAALGFDIFANPVARRAAEQARDSGDVVITGPTALVQDANGDEPVSFVMYMPVYALDVELTTVADRRRALLGWVDIPFRMGDLMAGLADQINPRIDIEIRDADTPGATGQLYHSDRIPHRQRAEEGELQVAHRISVGTREWTLDFSSTPEFRASAALVGRSSLIPLTGGSLSLALALLVFTIARGRDQSERRAARLSHLYHALSEVNQAIVRMDREADLFPLVCRMAVDYGEMKMAWIGRLEPATGRIVPVASHGEGVDYLTQVTVSSREDVPEGRGPTGSAVRQNHHVIVNDYLHDTTTAPWHSKASRYGWKAGAAFPIQRNGEPFAVLNVYHGKVGAFDGDVITLLREMSSDIGFALDNFDREAQRLAYERALAESEARLSAIMDNVGACIYLKDTRGCYTYVNRQVLELWGMTRDEVLGCDDTRFFDEHTVARVRANDRRVFEGGEIVTEEEVDTVKATGVTKTFWSVKIPLRDAHGDIYALCGISTDISDKKASQDRIRYLSNYDVLTGLPNRVLLQERAKIAITAAKAVDGPVALLYLDLDRFKIINDSLGHSVGDRVIKALSQRLTAYLHLDATLSRVGGDEFFLLLPGVPQAQVFQSAEQVLEIIAGPLTIEGRRLALTASIGVAFFPEHGRNLEELTQSADAALAQAKLKGRNRIEVFAEHMLARAKETLLVESELREALQRRQLVLHYQPQVDMNTGLITGVEALVRWQHPTKGLIPPARFIPVAEESGLIADIGTWVLQTAAAQQAAWQAEGLAVASVAVNLSVVQLYKTNFCELVATILRDNKLSHAMLELELTEGIAMEHSSRTLATLRQLQAMGVSLAIDDFGTGYSSLSYLKRYPVNRLKIDKSFVNGLADDAEDQAIVLAIIGIARGLGFRTVAEGVETREQWEFLRNHGCDEYQGYFFSKPVPAEEIAGLLRSPPV